MLLSNLLLVIKVFLIARTKTAQSSAAGGTFPKDEIKGSV
jgi:hypothetical protein